MGEFMDALDILKRTRPDKTAGDAFETVLGALLEDYEYGVIQNWVTKAFRPLILVALAALDNGKRKTMNTSSPDRAVKRRRIESKTPAPAQLTLAPSATSLASGQTSTTRSEFATLPPFALNLESILSVLDSAPASPTASFDRPIVLATLANGIAGGSKSKAKSRPAGGKENLH
ncbi:hypothetical protein FB45DRAFT_348790 [Roridomyces roridus]|uniref:Uncharacterized protein n=1 Tax=Roridomyces roridus TaxID=1738132 RepID=A0AAD7B487_9AGAR|nr:hypothetical protein FB45DRAFT_348790 [Roridomyces roridus]